MLRHVIVALALPLSSLAAQAGLVRVTITTANNAEFRLVGLAVDSAGKTVAATWRGQPVIGRARGMTQLVFSAGEALEISPVDSTTRVHVEVAENGRLIASADGRFVTVRKDTAGVSLEVQSRALRSLDPGKPDEASSLQALAQEMRKPPQS